jgi:putative oxidoreductase
MSNGSGLQAFGLTLLRLMVGTIFLMHGGQKLFMGFHNVAGFLGAVGIPLPTLAAIVLTLVEFVGGIALIVGLLTRYVAALLAIDMLVALITVHIKHGFFTSNGGVEFPLLLLIANINFILAGAGALGIDTLRRKKTSQATIGTKNP